MAPKGSTMEADGLEETTLTDDEWRARFGFSGRVEHGVEELAADAMARVAAVTRHAVAGVFATWA